MMTSLTQLIPSGKRLIEPFVGGSSVFMNNQHPELILSDANEALMNFYRCIKTSPDAVIEQCRALFCEELRNRADYEKIRNQFNTGLTKLLNWEDSEGNVTHAAQFIFMNKFGFNGLYRTNKKGMFNVPFGAKKSLPRIPIEAIFNMSDRLKDAQLFCGDFEFICNMASQGDVLYLDPPYVDAKVDSKSFNGYQAKGFNLHDQERVAEMAILAASRGAISIISNHDTEYTRTLYQGAELTELEVERTISAKAKTRGKAKEIVAVFRPI